TMAAMASLLVLAGALAGCSGSTDSTGTLPKPDDGLVVTKDTGILRGVVLDVSITPIPGAKVEIIGPAGASLEAVSAADGTFGLDGLAPGPYALTVTKAGYFPRQTTTLVKAGDENPPIVKVELAIDEATKPYAMTYQFDGYIECSITSPVVALAVCSFTTDAGVTSDTFNTFIELEREPQWVQHELVWEATQSTGNMFNFAARTATKAQSDSGTYDAEWGEAIGASPLIVSANSTVIERYGIGQNGTGLAPAVFAGGMEGTMVCDPSFGCLFGTGATLQQKFKLYTIVFYGYTPPEGWTFSAGQGIPQPA
ncbi:MAG TPA: carboxypeptidase-like regulatory domain-containing protein, partial [Candidatus Thermoplasmatota archaeon]|nr:carboxypeptidase-like regulatory domain-containing protein [Candidatus Thermoplasmatota archaeon]